MVLSPLRLKLRSHKESQSQIVPKTDNINKQDLSADLLAHGILKVTGHRALSLAMRACPAFQAASVPAVAMLAHESQVKVKEDENASEILRRLHFRWHD